MARTLVVCGTLVAAALWLANAAVADDKKADDSHFVKEAAGGGQLEVTLGQLAVDHAASADVKKFGQRMIDDHSKANKDLMAIADKKGIKVPAEVSKKHQELIDKLTKLKGKEFDRAYINAMVADHEEDVKEFEDQAKTAKDTDVKDFANKTLPVIREHLKMAKSIADSLK